MLHEINFSSRFNMSQPLITIGVTNYNAKSTIERCLKSALAQNWPSFEIVVVDDASTDSSPDIIKNIQVENPNIIFIRHEKNKGCAVARNTVLANAKGEYIAFFDDDDESLSNRINDQYTFLKFCEERLGTDKILCYASSMKKYDNGYTLVKPAVATQGQLPSGLDIFRYIFSGESSTYFWGDGTPTATLMVKKQNILGLKGFDESLRRVEDVDLALRAGMDGFYFAGTPSTLVIRYHSEGDDKKANINYISELYLVEKYRKSLQKLGSYRQTKYWYEIRSAYFNKKIFRFFGFILIYSLFFPKKTFQKFISTVPRRILHEIGMRKK